MFTMQKKRLFDNFVEQPFCYHYFTPPWGG